MKNDAKIKELLKEIEKRKAGVSKKPVIAWKTNLVFLEDNNNYINLNTIRDVNRYVHLYAGMIKDTERYTKASEELEVSIDSSQREWNGYTLDEWKEDFKCRIKLLQWEKENRDLKTMESKLKALRSEDAKTEDALSDIESLLNNK